MADHHHKFMHKSFPKPRSSIGGHMSQYDPAIAPAPSGGTSVANGPDRAPPMGDYASQMGNYYGGSPEAVS